MSDFHGVTFADPSDAPEVYRLMIALHQENGVFNLNEDKAAWMCAQLFEPGLGMVGVIRGPTEIEGAIALKRAQQEYSDDWFLSEVYNYVRPAYRKSDHAKRLIMFASECAADLKIPLLMGIVSTQRVSAKLRLYRRLLTPIGGFFISGTLPRLSPDVEAAADRDEDDDKQLNAYREAVERLIRAEDGKGRDKRASRHAALEKLRAVHGRVERTIPVNGHGGTQAEGNTVAM
jgi:GNAT superfamily N-acetyltransferase